MIQVCFSKLRTQRQQITIQSSIHDVAIFANSATFYYLHILLKVTRKF